jgi:DNA processing protein
MKQILGIDTATVSALIEKVGMHVADDASLAEAFARVAWSTIVEPGDRVAGALIASLGAPMALEQVIQRSTPQQVAHELGGTQGYAVDSLTEAEIAAGLERWIPRLNSADALRSLHNAAGVQAFLLTPSDELWPSGFEDVGVHQPVALWGRGSKAALSHLARSVALVGARASTGYGEHVTMELAAGLVDRGVAIVSGAAYGIDGMAHRAALASGGITVAFLAGGVDRFYPSGHDALLNRIIESGAVLAETPCGFAPTKWRFLQRNRLIAAASHATVVVEAGWRSGSLNTANHAASLARPLGAVPGPITSASSAGCHRLLREYDAVCVTTAGEILELLPGAIHGGGASLPVELELSVQASRVLDALAPRQQRSIDELARISGLSVRDVAAALGELELDQRARMLEGGWCLSS